MSKTKKLTRYSPLLFCFLALLIILGATLAWFTSSQRTSTNKVTANTGEDTMELYVSAESGTAFTEGKEAEIIQISPAELTSLMPVSTSDLKTFLTSTSNDGTTVSTFVEDSEGNNYYHGRVYIKAVKTNAKSGETMDLYLDTAQGNPVVANEGDEEILTATRLGLTFNETDPTLFYLSSNHISGNAGVGTMVSGEVLTEDQVITLTDGVVTIANDPSVALSDYSLNSSESQTTLPANALLNMTFDTIYTVDIYFYLEGCDSDCTDSISLDEIDLQLYFYGVLRS